MTSTIAMRTAPWRKIGLTGIAGATFVFFWVNGPLQEPAPVFEFEEHVTGFDEPVRVGEEFIPPKFALLGPEQRHAYYHIITPKEEPRPLFGIIGDKRTNPGLDAEVADLVLTNANQAAADPDTVTLKTALDMYYAEQRDDSGKPVKLHMVNVGLNKNIKGYAGPIDIGMTVGIDGTIGSVEHLFSMETTSYLNDIESDGFYERFQNIPLDGQIYVIDAVSGATLTSEAIARSVSDLVSIARESPLEIYIDTEPAGFEVEALLPNTWIIDAVLIAVLFVIAATRLNRRSTVFSLGFSIVTILYLGFYLNNSFTYVTYTQPFLGISWSYVLGIYAALVLLSAIWDSNSYCKYICPYGNVQKILTRYIPWHGKLKISHRLLEAIRWAITLTLVAGIVMGLRDWGSFELFPDFFGLEIMSSPWFWLSLAMVLVSAYYPMLWCRMLCPTGAVLDGIAVLGRTPKRRKSSENARRVEIPITVEQAPA